MSLEMISKYKLIFISIVLISYSGCISTSSETKGEYVGPSGILYDYTPEKLEAALKSGKPTLLDFSVDWCGECIEMIPIMEELRTEYGGRANIMTVNADAEIDLQRRYNIRYIPSFVFLDKDGNIAEVLIGYQEKEAMKGVLDGLIQ